jgi:hypothetical protein
VLTRVEPNVFVSNTSGCRYDELCVEYVEDAEMRWLIDRESGQMFVYLTHTVLTPETRELPTAEDRRPRSAAGEPASADRSARGRATSRTSAAHQIPLPYHQWGGAKVFRDPQTSGAVH